MTWYRRARQTPDRLERIRRDGHQDPFPLIIIEVWLTLVRAPARIQQAYRQISENELLRQADTHSLSENEHGYGLLISDAETPEELMHKLGAFLRAAERFHAAQQTGSAPVDPNVEWRHVHDGKAFFLLPVPHVFRNVPRDGNTDQRHFTARGLTRLRLIPAEIDGSKVRLTYLDIPPLPEAEFHFGSALFSGIAFQDDTTPNSFRITAVTAEDLQGTVIDGLKASHNQRFFSVVFPELTIDPETLENVASVLAGKPWIDTLPTPPGPPPLMVLAGSWHVEIKGKYRNRLTVLDGNGKHVLHHDKRMVSIEQGRSEAIEPGAFLDILVVDKYLVSFGICLDFCDRQFSSPYGWLDVDFVIVPSCGNDVTMQGHIATATDLQIRRKTRSHVVQQGYPAEREALGYVLAPDGNPQGQTVDSLKTRENWSVFAIRALSSH